MNCEICGRKISKSIRIEIDKSILTVCYECSRFGTIVRKERKIKSLKTPRPSRIQDEEEEVIENFGEIIKKRREELGISREEFAKKLGEKESVIRRIENEEMYPSRDLLLKIERLLKTSLRVKLKNVVKEKMPSFNITLGDVAIVREGKQNK